MPVVDSVPLIVVWELKVICVTPIALGPAIVRLLNVLPVTAELNALVAVDVFVKDTL